ncbi:hypothetical protein ACFOLA_08985 [Salinicoccus hispanicus]|uniref:Uncharacterized protein n=1 Tax=Salinicoccus hispanicus TaxID=157225 RepID=A0A6N8TWA2_9STAP|nr:hypothetical protein [Salinicoccus hispanicus]MXQ49970.1 hypothetical protein [Salinicoccus hispanicus]
MGIIEKKTLMGLIILQLIMIGFLNFITFRRVDFLDTKFAELKDEYDQLFDGDSKL